MPPEEVLSRIFHVLSRFEGQDLSPMVIQEIADVSILSCRSFLVHLGSSKSLLLVRIWTSR